MNSEYIQWQLTPEERNSISAEFNEVKQDKINTIRLNTYSQIIKSKFNNGENEKNYIKLVNSIIGNETFKQSLDQAIEKLPMPQVTNLDWKFRRDEILKEANGYQDLVNNIKIAVANIIETFGIEGFEDAAILNKESLEALFKLTGKTNLLNDRIIYHSTYKKLDAAVKGHYIQLLKSLSEINGLDQKGNSDNSIKIISTLLTRIQILIGFASEEVIVNTVDSNIEKIAKELNSLDKISVSHTGTKKGENGGYKIQTSDLSFILSSNGQDSNLNFSLPNLGMSLKRSGKASQTKNKTISLKSATNYGQLLSNINPMLLTNFYTLYSYTDPGNDGDISKSVLSSAYKLMKANATLSALIGNIGAEDLVFVFVHNNTPYTIFDILDKIKDEKSDPFTIKPAFYTQRNTIIEKHKSYYEVSSAYKERRSKNIRSYINNISAKVSVKLRGLKLSNI